MNHIFERPFDQNKKVSNIAVVLHDEDFFAVVNIAMA